MERLNLPSGVTIGCAETQRPGEVLLDALTDVCALPKEKIQAWERSPGAVSFANSK